MTVRKLAEIRCPLAESALPEPAQCRLGEVRLCLALLLAVCELALITLAARVQREEAAIDSLPEEPAVLGPHLFVPCEPMRHPVSETREGVKEATPEH